MADHKRLDELGGDLIKNDKRSGRLPVICSSLGILRMRRWFVAAGVALMTGESRLKICDSRCNVGAQDLESERAQNRRNRFALIAS
jgi:hypothetical protein